jgi:hypothetical protein
VLKRGALLGIGGVAVIGVIAVVRGGSVEAVRDPRGSERERGIESGSGSERGSERGSDSERGIERERGGESERGSERESESASERTLSRMATIRQDVHLLEIQRLDARERGDHEAEARLDTEITAARAEHDRLRDELTGPEGI